MVSSWSGSLISFLVMSLESILEKASDFSLSIDFSDNNASTWNVLWAMQNVSKGCDVQLHGYDGKMISAHSCVLAATNDFLREAVAQQNPAVTPSITLQIPALSSPVITAVLSFLYTGKMLISSNYLQELCLAADILNIDKLQQICKSFSPNESDSPKTGQASKDYDINEPDQELTIASEETDVIEYTHTVTTTSGTENTTPVAIKMEHQYEESIKEFAADYQQTAYVNLSKVTVLPGQGSNEHIIQIGDGKRRQGGRKSFRDMEGFICGISGCKSGHDSLSELQTHRRQSHDPTDYEFCCELCGRAFKYKYNIKGHMDRHLERDFQCSNCDKSFSTKADLAAHYKTHTGQKPFKCNFCDKSFSQGCNLLKHKRSVHNDVFLGGQRLHECTECGRSYKTQDTLHKHEKRHSKTFTCSVCHEQFRLRKHLLAHQKSVHGEEFLPAEGEHVLDIYTCAHCDKRFLNVNSLALHQQTVHRKAKRFACAHPDCSYQAYFKSAIDKHYKRHVLTVSKSRDVAMCDTCRTAFPSQEKLSLHHDTSATCAGVT